MPSHCILTVVLVLSGQAPPALPADTPPALRQRYEAAEQQLQSDGHSVAAWSQLLDALYRLDLPERALGAARVALEQYPEEVDIRMRAARALYRSGRLDEAARLFDATTDVTRHPVAATVRSRLLHAEGRAADALACATRGLESAPQDPELLYQIALLSGQLNEHAQAAVAYGSASRSASALEGYPGRLIVARCTGRSDLHRRLVNLKANECLRGTATPFDLPRAMPLPTLDVHLGDHGPFRMLFDPSGSRLLSLDTAVAGQAEVHPIADAALEDITGARTATHWALVPRLTFGDCGMINVVTQIYDLRAEGLPDIDGIFGSGLLADRRVVIDFEGRTIRLEASRPPQPSADALHAALGIRFVAGDQAVVPVTIEDRQINAILAFGSPVTCFSAALLARQFGPTQLADSEVGGRPARIGPGLPFRIAQRTITQPGSIGLPLLTDETSRLAGTRIDAVLGWDVFRDMRRLTLDVSNSALEIDWAPRAGRGAAGSPTP